MRVISRAYRNSRSIKSHIDMPYHGTFMMDSNVWAIYNHALNRSVPAHARAISPTLPDYQLPERDVTSVPDVWSARAISCGRAIVRPATGFSQANARIAAVRSQAIITQKTPIQLPVRTDASAATGPAKIDAKPLEVYTMP